MNLLEKHYDELGTNFRSVWDFYIKFYTVFLTVNLAALALVVQYVQPDQRTPIVWSFMIQNIFSGVTAIGVALYSQHVARQQDALVGLLRLQQQLPDGDSSLALSSTVPIRLAVWGGVANGLSHVLFIVCWFAVGYFMKAPAAPPGLAT